MAMVQQTRKVFLTSRTKTSPSRNSLAIPGHGSLSFACMASLNEGDHRNEIERLEAEIDELTARIESCHKFILAGRIAVMGGAVALIATLVGGISFNPSVVGIAGAAVLGGILAVGSNRSTAKEAAQK